MERSDVEIAIRNTIRNGKIADKFNEDLMRRTFTESLIQLMSHAHMNGFTCLSVYFPRLIIDIEERDTFGAVRSIQKHITDNIDTSVAINIFIDTVNLMNKDYHSTFRNRRNRRRCARYLPVTAKELYFYYLEAMTICTINSLPTVLLRIAHNYLFDEHECASQLTHCKSYQRVGIIIVCTIGSAISW